MVPTRCAVCDLTTDEVVNIIIALPSDIAPDDCQLIEVMNGQLCDIGWFWAGVEFTPPEVP